MAEKKNPTPPRKLYADKPMSTKEQAKKAGFPSEQVYNQYRAEPDLRPEHAKRKPGSRF